MAQLLMAFWNNENGATSIEYALIAVIVSVGIVASLQSIGGAVVGMIESVTEGFK